jgi:hypothetical protein
MVVEGNGKVTSTPAGIDCGTVCVGAFDKGSTVHLSAAPLGDPFFEWSPPCGTLPECDMPLVNDAIFGASFGAPFQLIVPNIIETVNMTLGIGGLGHATVTLADAKGSKPCPPTPSTCVVPFAVPDLVTMTIAHDATSRFDRWLSSCPAAASTCTVDTQVVDSAAQIRERELDAPLPARADCPRIRRDLGPPGTRGRCRAPFHSLNAARTTARCGSGTFHGPLAKNA